MFKKQFILKTLLILIIALTTGCGRNYELNGGLQEMKFGKNITVSISDGEIVDAVYVQKLVNEEISIPGLQFHLWDKEASQKLIDYLEENDYIIVPAKYIINQTWGFEDGMFVINKIENGKVVAEKREIFKFKVKDN